MQWATRFPQNAGIGRPARLRLVRSLPSADSATIAPVDVGRFGWLATVLACLVTVLILVLEGYYGYAGVTFAVAVSAAINLR